MQIKETICFIETDETLCPLLLTGRGNVRSVTSTDHCNWGALTCPKISGIILFQSLLR